MPTTKESSCRPGRRSAAVPLSLVPALAALVTVSACRSNRVAMDPEHLESTGDYGAEGYVFQQLAPIPMFDGQRPVIGSWVIGQEAGGMGIREAASWVTGNTSRFVPHLFR